MAKRNSNDETEWIGCLPMIGVVFIAILILRLAMLGVDRMKYRLERLERTVGLPPAPGGGPNDPSPRVTFGLEREEWQDQLREWQSPKTPTPPPPKGP